jgi:murein DD-endopeptidase MepM/ murein hydrolase activator NlpD
VYGADVDEIAQFNGLDPDAPLAIGSTVIIPGGDFQSPTPGIKRPTTGGGSTQGSVPSYSGYYANPVPGARLTQRLHGHNGVDFGTPRGTPVHAAANGTVIIVRNTGWNGGYGNYIVVTHPNGTQTLYAHLTNAIVAPGQAVTQGQTIGYSGNTGKSTGAHLHFEVRGARNPFGR